VENNLSNPLSLFKVEKVSEIIMLYIYVSSFIFWTTWSSYTLQNSRPPQHYNCLQPVV